MRYAVWLLALVALAALAQQENRGKAITDSKGKSAVKSDDKKGPAPLFQNKLGYRASKTTKESTTLGFNGIDPSGKLSQQMLAKGAASDDQQKVTQMAANVPPPADLLAFLKAGGLKRK